MNKDLNKLMKTYNTQQSEAKEYHELRKNDMVKKAIGDADKKKIENVQENEQIEDLDKTRQLVGTETKKKSYKTKDTLNEIKSQLESNKEELASEKAMIDQNINILRQLQDELSDKYKELNISNKK